MGNQQVIDDKREKALTELSTAVEEFVSEKVAQIEIMSRHIKDFRQKNDFLTKTEVDQFTGE
jgi:hypothetical protein